MSAPSRCHRVGRPTGGGPPKPHSAIIEDGVMGPHPIKARYAATLQNLMDGSVPDLRKDGQRRVYRNPGKDPAGDAQRALTRPVSDDPVSRPARYAQPATMLTGETTGKPVVPCTAKSGRESLIGRGKEQRTAHTSGNPVVLGGLLFTCTLGRPRRFTRESRK